jgi:hypothetical protein
MLRPVPVYVILLCGVDDHKPGYALYVGETGLTPAHRFANHKAGYKASKWVKNYGECLLPSLYEHLAHIGSVEAKDLERKIAESLRDAGIPVYGGH